MSAHISSHPYKGPSVTRGALTVPLLAAVVAGGAGLWVTTAVPSAQRAAVAVFCGVAAVLLGVVLAVAANRSRTIGRLQERVTELETTAAAKEIEATRLAEETIPSAVRRLREGGSVDTVITRMERPTSRAHQLLLRALLREIGDGERMRASAMAACANAAGRVQALATSMLADLREMENRHDETVLGDLLKLDHTTAQAGRIADSIAVLTGARSGRRWTKPIVMESVLRGAIGRISAFQRVRVHSASNAAVAGYAAEGVMHALAELMDNAASFSPPTEEVHVYVEETHAGVVVTIEDGGLVMGPAALDRAQKSVSSESLDLMSLSGTRLGLAVVGCLARKHGLTVSFRPSARGGTGVVVLIPQQLITHVNQDAVVLDALGSVRSGVPRQASAQAVASTATATAAPAATAPAPATSPSPSPSSAPEPAAQEPAAPEPAAPEPAAQEPAAQPSRPVNGLPKRRRGETLAAATRAAAQAAEAEPKAKTSRPRPEEAGARFGAFRQAARGGFAAGAPCDTEPSVSADHHETAESAEPAENDKP
ncbi:MULTISPECIES: sensor histidine kinase [Streptomyces violaceusniger group]|uniref:histidine kinase n=1 Tax=Streptomyces antimycoticus TaxID=68175 RepID=A0ABD5J8K3_9ACTN|nr:ATP-binding protein [Streptomyces violaceusniger]MEE4584668.1 ATP-binding protein [Streptomyces sp. DSM 41602]